MGSDPLRLWGRFRFMNGTPFPADTWPEPSKLWLGYVPRQAAAATLLSANGRATSLPPREGTRPTARAKC